jgi:hypothetical protein
MFQRCRYLIAGARLPYEFVADPSFPFMTQAVANRNGLGERRTPGMGREPVRWDSTVDVVGAEAVGAILGAVP